MFICCFFFCGRRVSYIVVFVVMGKGIVFRDIGSGWCVRGFLYKMEGSWWLWGRVCFYLEVYEKNWN